MSFETITSILQIIFADIILSGDNALVIGMAAAGLAPEFRRRAIMIGMMMAAGMRIVFAVIASFLISIKGILLLGGMLLAWVCWRFYKDLKEFNAGDLHHGGVRLADHEGDGDLSLAVLRRTGVPCLSDGHHAV